VAQEDQIVRAGGGVAEADCEIIEGFGGYSLKLDQTVLGQARYLARKAVELAIRGEYAGRALRRQA
jgi:hypothetical protein